MWTAKCTLDGYCGVVIMKPHSPRVGARPVLLSAMPTMQHMGKPRTGPGQHQPEGEWCLLAELGQECIMQGDWEGDTGVYNAGGLYRIGGGHSQQ